MRIERVNSELQRQLTEVIRQEVDDPVVSMLSIIHVDTTKDLQEARVYYSLLDETSYEKAQKALEAMTKTIRVHLAKRIAMRLLPRLRFIPDDSIKYSVDISKRIEEITGRPMEDKDGK
jgi:ribosome-binding factor A